MSASAPPSRHLLRWIALAVLAVIIALAIALAVHIHNLLQPERFTELLENDMAAAGLKLRLDAPAEPTLFPRPGVKLQGFSLTNVGSRTPALRAAGATIVVPWSTLWNGEVAIERVDVRAPQIDLDELGPLLARLPQHKGSPRLPTITTGVHMSGGTLIRHGSPLLYGFSVETGALAPGQPFLLETSARTASGRHVSATVSTIPSAAHHGVIDFQSLSIDLARQQGVELQLEGRGSWRGGKDFAMQLKGTLHHRPLAPPSARPGAAASTASVAEAAIDKVALDVAPARKDKPITIALQVDGTDTHADFRLQPTEFGRWWNQVLAANPKQPPGALPFTGNADIKRLELGSLKATGLTIEAGPDLQPASGATAPAPATSTAN